MHNPNGKKEERISEELHAAVQATQKKIDHAFANGHKFAAKLKQAPAA